MSIEEPNLNNSLIYTTLTLNSTTLYSLDNPAVISKYKLNDLSEVIANQMSSINSSKSHIGSIPISLSNLDLSLYYVKYILPSDDIVTVLTLYSADLPKYFAIGVLENILKEYKEYREVSSSNVEFKIKFNQIIKFHELQFQKSYLESNKKDLNQVKNILNDNIEQVLERNERINLLVNKTDRINTLSNNFRTNTVKVKRKMWWQNVKFWAILVVVGLLLLAISFKILFG